MIAFAFMGITMLPALAEHSAGGDFYTGNDGAERWSEIAEPTYCLEGFEGPLTDGEYTNMKNSTIAMVNGEWENGTNISTNWGMVSPAECANNYNYDSYAPSCLFLEGSLPNISSRISYEDFEGADGNNIGEGFQCDFDENGYIDFFWIVMCPPSACGGDWHFNHQTNGGDGDRDFSGVFSHEFGHATGFNGHFSGGSQACDNDGSNSTMCSGTDWGPATVRGPVSCGCAWRDLTSHDIGAVDEVYPSP